MNMDPNGRIPPRSTMTTGSMNHFFSGIGLGTALILGKKEQERNRRSNPVAGHVFFSFLG